ncbi:MAG: hypothetical protein MEQ84_07780 [Mesorhizobium sp.]|nr:hypothetical protein [Mesorhizobium sp.]
MLGGKGSTIVFYGAVALFGAFLAVWILDFALLRADWCVGAEVECARAWIAALSGWAAALGAGLTIVVLYRQLVEQRKQTAFLLGDARPTVDVLEADEELFALVFRIVNWNRRTILIKEIHSSQNPPLTLRVEAVRVDREELHDSLFEEPIFARPVRIPGWVDRSKSPSVGRITIRAFGAKPREAIKMREVHDTFRLHGILLGETHETIELHGSAPFTTI